jgi:hypothetical protein
LSIIKVPSYDKTAFDFEAVRDIFLVDEKTGQHDKTLASKITTKQDWEESVRLDTINAFKDIDPNNRGSVTADKVEAVAETIYQKVKRGVKTFNPVPLFMNVVPGTLGKTVEAHEVEGGKMYSRTYGGYMRVSRLRHQTYTVTTAPESIHLEIPVEALKTGRYTVADLTFAATQAILRYKIRLAFDTYVAAYPTGATGFVTNCSSTAVTNTLLNGAIDSLADYDVDSITVIGRYSALTPITDFTGYSDNALEEIRRQGGLGKYRGADLVKLKYVVDEVYGNVPFETTSIFLVSNEKNFNRYVEVKQPEKQAWISPGDKMFHLTFDIEDGAAIWKQKFGHRLYDVG